MSGLALAAAMAFLPILPAAADTLTLANGDHLTGTVEKSDGKQVTFKTDNAGEINVQWSAVKQLTSDKPLYVVTSDQKTVNGIVTTDGADLVVTPANGPATRVPMANAATLRSEAEQAAYEHSLHPGLFSDWQLDASVGFAAARGNSETTNLNVGFSAARTTLHDKVLATASSLYASNDTPGSSAVTANDIRGAARYDRNFGSRFFVFGSGDFETNQLQLLNLRTIISAGGGFHAIKTSATVLDLLAGGNYTRESYSTGVQRNLAAITLGDDFSRKLGKSIAFTQHLDFYPDLSDIGQYRFAIDVGVIAKINKWLGWQTSASDRYLSDPIPTTKGNDFIFTTGLNVALTH